MDAKEQAAREQMREWGKKGGRPRTVPHVEGWPGCRCAECRAKRAGKRGRQVDVKVGPAGPTGAATSVEKGGQEQPSPLGFESPSLHQTAPEGWTLVSELSRITGFTERQIRNSAVKYQEKSRFKERREGDIVTGAWGQWVLDEWKKMREKQGAE